jgi:hypothetical protein
LIFLPNFFDKYTAFLRLAVDNLINKKGFSVKYVEMLKKINFAEGFFYKEEIEPLDVKEYILLLLHVCQLKTSNYKKTIKVTLRINGNFLINKKLLTILLLQLYKSCKKITVAFIKGKIVIMCDRLPPASLKTVTALNGYCLKEVKSQRSAIIIKAERTEKSPIKTNKDWLNLTNPYSLINLFLQ